MTGVRAQLLYDLQSHTGDDHGALYAVALEQAAWADRNGFASISFPEHHGTDLGYLPAPTVFAAAVAGATTQLRLSLSALVVPLHDPVRLAEQLAVLDLVSGGRVEVVVGAGYVREEFAMAGLTLGARGGLVEEAVRVLRAAWTGDPFEHAGRTVRVTPRPLQRPGPPILLGGASDAAARRAARIADGFRPALPGFWDTYREACAAAGRPDPGAPAASGPFFLHVADDPDAARARIAPAVLRGVNQYLALAAAAAGGPAFALDAVEQAEAIGMACIVDPDACVARCEELGAGATVLFQPLFGGLDPDDGWASLELFVKSVLPRLGQGTREGGS